MTESINASIIPVINRNGISKERLLNLIYIKEFIDRTSSKSYLSGYDLEKLEKKYSVKPDILTWGDYFQAELATTHKSSDDSMFMDAIETVKFDVISSYLIFRDKDNDFMKWVDSYEIPGQEEESMSDMGKEMTHLKILKNYYTELGLTDNFTKAEMTWYSSFKDAVAI